MWICILLAAGGILKIGGEIIKQQKCPRDIELRDYFNRNIDLDGEMGRRITSHLGICESCRTKITNF